MAPHPPPSVSSHSIVWAAAWAIGAAIAGRCGGLAAAIAVAAAAACLGSVRGRFGSWVWAVPAAFAASSPAPESLRAPPGPVWIVGIVQSGIRWEPRREMYSFRVQHRGHEFLCVVADAPRSFRVLPGDRIQGFGRLPNQPNRVRLRLPLRVIAAHDGLQVQSGGLGLRRLATACRLTMQDTLLDLIPGSAGSLLCHLVLGRGPEILPATVRAHRETGLSHLLAVSGAHLTMLGWLLACAYAVCTRRDPLVSRRFRRGCGMTLLFYGLLTGMDPPVFRATVAAFLVLGCAGHHRRLPVVAVLAVPAICTAILAPDDLFGVSFQLSYAAVFGLSLAYGTSSGSGGWWRGPLRCSVWATLCTMPLTLWYFGSIAPWSIILTPLLGPLVAGMLGLGLIVCVIHELSPDAAQLLATPLAGMTRLYVESIQLAAHLPGTPMHAVARPEAGPLLLAAVLGALGVLSCGGRRGIAWLSLCLSAPHFLSPLHRPDPGLQLLAVGHGQAALAQLSDGRSLLVDCGSLAAPHRAARVTATALLPHRTLDLLVITHGDADHVGGIVPLLERVRITEAWMPAEMRGSKTAERLLDSGSRLHFVAPGNEQHIHPSVTLWHPPTVPPRSADQRANRNEHSLWTQVRWSSLSVLLTGDATPRSSEQRIQTGQPLLADVLVLPHHGRPQPGIPALLAAVRPRIALVTAATKDGDSAQGQVAREHGYLVWNTGQVGTIRIRAANPPTLHAEYAQRLPTRPDRSLPRLP